MLGTDVNGRAEAELVKPGRCTWAVADLVSENADWADSGRGGMSLPANRALFWAAIVSLSEERAGTEVVLFEKFGRRVSDALGEASRLGFPGCFSSNCLYLLSREAIMLVVMSVI